MKLLGLKYFSVSFLVILFALRGLENALPLLSGYFFPQSQQEMTLDTEPENSSEKNTEKSSEKKEPVDFYNDPGNFMKYTIVSEGIPYLKARATTKVFLPIVSPPPEIS